MSKDFDVCREIAKKITSKYNQHDSMIFVGSKGSGKSWASLTVAYNTSIEVAKIKGGEPSDYFTLENVAIITKDEVVRVLKYKMNPYNIIVFDDIGTTWNSRDFAKKFNKIMNNIWQTFRTRNCFLIMTVPDQSYIDKLPRESVHYFAEVVRSHFDEGYVETKIKESIKLAQSGKNIFPYIVRDRVKYPRHLIYTPPAFLTTPYEKLREDIEKESSDKGIAEIEAMEDEEGESKVSKRLVDVLRAPIFAFHEAGFKQKDIAQKVGCSQQTVSLVILGEQ